MKASHWIGLGVVVVGTGTALRAEEVQDWYEPLREELVAKKQEALAGAMEARRLADEYEEVLKDPDVETDERPVLRLLFIEQQAVARRLQEEAGQLHEAGEALRRGPEDEKLTVAALREAYGGLGELGGRARNAWDELIATRAELARSLEARYAEELARATAELERLDSAARARELLLNATDSRRTGNTDAEFQVALRLPRIVAAVEGGFGVRAEVHDDDAQAQLVLLALTGYSQFFWDFESGSRGQLGENERPSDANRNIFGVADGMVLASDAVASNRSSTYYLSDSAKEGFNARIAALWGPETRVTAARWNQNSAPAFRSACESLSMRTEQALQPNEEILLLLDGIDVLVAAKKDAEEAIERIHLRFREALEDAKSFGPRAGLSSAHYNAEIWDKDSLPTIARFEAAQAYLDAQLAECAAEDWRPDPRKITRAVETLRITRHRFESVKNVKMELAVLLE